MSFRWLEMDGSGDVYSGEKIILKSTSSFSVGIPTSPATGDMISFMDGAGLCGTNNITISRNGNKIMGLEEDLVVDSNGATFDLIYKDSSKGWVLR